MNLEQLRGFYAVAQEGSFTKAAEKLFLTQPAISLQVRALEKELGEQLFNRTGKSVRLTQAGEIFKIHVKSILDSLEDARNQVAELQGLQRGRLVIGCSDTITIYILAPILQAYNKRYPKVEIAIRNKTSLEVAELVLTNTVDFGIVTLPIKNPTLHSEVFLRCADVAICAPGHLLAEQEAVSLDELSQYPLLLLEPGSNSRLLLEKAFDLCDIPLSSAMDLGSIGVIKKLVSIGLGVSIVPEFALRTEEEGLVALPINELPQREIGVIRCRKSNYLPLAVKEFLSMFREGLRACVRSIDFPFYKHS